VIRKKNAALLMVAIQIAVSRGASAEVATNEPISAGARLAAAAIDVADGFRVVPVASEPLLANPVAFCFDPDGRIYIAETFRVHQGVEDNRRHLDWIDDDLAARTVADRRAYVVRRMGERIGEFTAVSDQVRRIEDTDGDGVYDRTTVFSTGYNDVEEGAAAGVLWSGDRLLFTCIPSLWELRDADCDGSAEQKRVLASGFGVHFALFGHDLHGLCQGPDGKIYFSIGDRGLNVETPKGPLVNPDSGAVLRCNPDGSDLDLFATGLRNPQELAFNEYGDLFTVDNNSDAGDRARLVHVVEGMQAGWRMSYQYLADRGPFNREKIWHTQNNEQPASIVPPLAHITAGPSGLVRYSGTGFPAHCDGSFFVCDFRGGPATSGVWQFWIEPHEASYRLKESILFAVGVLATDCDFGPDGALYLSDWVNGWNGIGSGRIHRVVTDDAAAREAAQTTQMLLRRISTMPIDEMFRLLGHADMRVRTAAQQRLVAAGPGSSQRLIDVAFDSAGALLARLHAIWGLGQLAASDPELLDRLAALARDKDAEVRAQSAKTLGRGAEFDESTRREWGDSLVPLLADRSPRVRLFAAISLGKLKHRGALAGLLELARQDADRDPVLRHAVVMGLSGSQSSEALLAAAKEAGSAERLAIVIALGRQRSPHVAQFLRDKSERVQLEAARIIWDTPLPEAYGALAAMIDEAPVSEPLVRRVLAANSAVGTPENVSAVIRYGLRSEIAQEMREMAWEFVRQWASPSPRDPVHGQWRPSTPRPHDKVLAALREALPEIVEADEMGAMGQVVAAEMGIDEVYPTLLPILEDKLLAAALRARAVSAMGNADEVLLNRAIKMGLSSNEPLVRIAARQMLVNRLPGESAEMLRQAVMTATPSEQQAAIQSLSQLDLPETRDIIGELLSRVEEGSCPPGIALDVLEAAAKSSDAAIVERQRQNEQRTAGASPLAAFAVCLEGGNAASGQRVFEENAALACRRCHSRTTGEQLIGPNLAEIGLRRSRGELLESIVMPNAKITEGFQTTTMLLDTGRIVSGVLRREDGKHAVLVDAEGREVVVDLDAVEEQSQGVSAMPEDLVKQMTRRELRDLVEYLSGLRTAPEIDRMLPEVGAGD
jgi:quinoprotein glucose dehydrogenase